MKLHLLLILIFTFSLSVFAQILPEPVAVPPKGIIAPKAIFLGKPPYPPAARDVRASGTVEVKVTINEEGKVISAQSLTGHPLLRKAAENAALESKFIPATNDGKPMKYSGNIVFNFKQQTDWENVGANLLSLINNTSVVSAQSSTSDGIWQGYEAESREFADLQVDESTAGKQKRAATLLNTLRYKLRTAQPFDYWQLNLGVVQAAITGNSTRMGGEKLFYTYLDELADLVKNAPPEVSLKRLAGLSEIAKYAEEKSLSKETRTEIARKITENRNLSLNGAF